MQEWPTLDGSEARVELDCMEAGTTVRGKKGLMDLVLKSKCCFRCHRLPGREETEADEDSEQYHA